MDTNEQDETLETKADAANAQTEEKDTNKDQAPENKKEDTQELNETQLDEVAAGYSPQSFREYMSKQPF